MDEINLVGKTVDLHINGIGIVVKHDADKLLIQIGKVIVAAHVNDIEPNESETTD